MLTVTGEALLKAAVRMACHRDDGVNSVVQLCFPPKQPWRTATGGLVAWHVSTIGWSSRGNCHHRGWDYLPGSRVHAQKDAYANSEGFMHINGAPNKKLRLQSLSSQPISSGELDRTATNAQLTRI